MKVARQRVSKKLLVLPAMRSTVKFLQLILGQPNGRVTERSIGMHAPLPVVLLKTMKLLVQAE